jgi:hypothetical protein
MNLRAEVLLIAMLLVIALVLAPLLEGTDIDTLVSAIVG